MRFHFILTSQNAKLGPIPCVVAERFSCPPSCELKNHGCYAEGGPIRLVWNKVTDGTLGDEWPELTEKLRTIPRRSLWRYAAAGDLPGYLDAIDGTMLKMMIAATRGTLPIVYSHKPVIPTKGVPPQVVERNRDLVERAVKQGFTINLSGNNPAHADLLADLAIAPVVCVLSTAYGRRKTKRRPKQEADQWAETIPEWRDRIALLPTHTPGGRRIAVCPADFTDTTCARCGACARVRDTVIGFPAHGSRKSQAQEVALRVAA